MYSRPPKYYENNIRQIYTDGSIQQTEENPQKIMQSEKVLCTGYKLLAS